MEDRYEVWCETCYSCTIAKTHTKKYANVAATAHLNIYGHNVHIKDNGKNKARREREQVLRDSGLVKVKGALGGTYWE